MGVTGLWRLIDPAGKPVPVETLENKVLAVDISIWLHQMVKGYQDSKGAPLPNAHLMGLFQRLCKLLYFRIKPIFVFDGAFPDLKKETIARRQDNKAKYHSESERLKRELALLLSKKTVVGGLLGKQISPKKSNATSTNDDDLFKLPALPEKEEESDSESEDEQNSSGSVIDLHSVDVESENFKSLPIKEKYDLLIELKETRKMNSWGRLHELPKESNNFSDFQMQRLLKRKKVQECLEETEKEMGDTGMSLNDLEFLLNEEGIETKIDTIPTRRIASNNTTRFVLINNVKQTLADAKKKKEVENNPGTSKTEDEKPETSKIEDEIPATIETQSSKNDELEDDLQKAIKMSMECVNDADTSACTSKTDDSWTSFMTESDYSDSEEEDGFVQPELSTAKAYIMQYSDFTHKAIDKMIAPKNSDKSKSLVPNVDQIIEELNKEKSVIVDNVDLSSSDDDCIEELTDSNNKITEKQNQSVVELNTTNEDLESSMDIDTTQSSVVCVENPVQNIISLDPSTENDMKEKEIISKTNLNAETASIKESDSSDGEFEEVPEADNTFIKPVVQLTLKMDSFPEDDIFADVFIAHKEKTENVVDNKLSEIFVVEDALPNPKDKIAKNNDEIIAEAEKLEQEPKSKEIVTIQTAVNENIATKPDLQITETIHETKKTEASEPISNNAEAFQEQSKSAQEKVTKEVTQLPRKPISTEELNSMAAQLDDEEQGLLQEKGRLDRIGRNITEQMTKEAQELLQLFGIPYIVAPMEAEAQCAFLETIKLTDGTITDDSDIWLFGGRTVYKNFFNQKKHVLQFLAERIERSFNLTREQLVLLALLVGSDYTTGLTGVGPVTALEILASFPFNKKQVFNETSKQAQAAKMVSGLQEFKQWVRAGKRTDNVTLKKKLKNVSVTDDFPSVRVVQAYLEPNVEKSDDKFSWGDIDLTLLRDYTRAKFGWSQNKLDEIIKPVLKRMQERKSQKSVHDYFKKKIDVLALDNQMSKRVKAAIQKMGPETPIEGQDGPLQENVLTEQTSIVKKRKINKKTCVKELVNNEAGPSKPKQMKSNVDNILIDQGVKVVSQTQDDKTGKSTLQINIPKSDRFQEIIPQREKDKHSILQNKMKAIEIFRKTKMDRKKKNTKRKVILPKEKAELSESDSD